ncbi:MAG: TolC family protein [Muribaculaceae bacterium]|nr:TolC family protein [Muribaculaceae bacterium]
MILRITLAKITVSTAFSILLLFFPFFASYAYSIEETAMKILTEGPEFISETFSLESRRKSLATQSNLPDPEVAGEYLVLPKDVDNRWTAELRWSVEWPGVYKARSKEAQMSMNHFQQSVWLKRNERLFEIRNYLLDYIYCQLKLELLDNLIQNNDTIFQLAEKAAKGGELTLLDLNKIKLEYANIKGAKATILDEKTSAINSLSVIFGKDCSTILSQLDCSIPEIKIPTEEELINLKNNAPALKAADAEAMAAHEAKNVAKMEALPALSLGYKHAFEDGMHFNGLTWGISIPIFSSRGKQKAANAQIVEAEFNVEAQNLEIEADLEALVKKLHLLTGQINEIAPLVENVDYNSTLLKAYQGRVITLIEYISDRNYFTNAAIELLDLRLAAAKTEFLIKKYAL